MHLNNIMYVNGELKLIDFSKICILHNGKKYYHGSDITREEDCDLSTLNYNLNDFYECKFDLAEILYDLDIIHHHKNNNYDFFME